MINQNFKEFCSLLSDNLILQTYTAFGVMVDLKNLLSGIKTDIYSELYAGNNNSSIYLDLLLNEIEKTHYPKKYDVNKIKQWLTKHNITLDEIFNQNIFENQFHKVIDYDTYTGDNILVQIDKSNYPLFDEALELQQDFLLYFKWFYANELINFINNLKKSFKPKNNSTKKSPVFETQYLDEFCKQIQDINSLNRNSFLHYYEFGMLHFTNYLKEEIYKNIASLSVQKSLAYLNFVQTKISNTNFYNTPHDVLEPVIEQYDTKDMPFPYKENQNIKSFISTCYNRENLDEWEREKMCDLQQSFFEYASMIEAKKIVEFINGIIEERDLASDSDNFKSIVYDNEASDKSIFKKDGETILDALLAKIEINKTNIKKRGNQAKLMAIWHNADSFRMIFKPYIQKKEYILYLNKKFVTEISTKSNSDYSNNLQLITDSLESIKEN